MVNHNAIVQAAGTLRRIANQLAWIATGRIATPAPQLDPATELAREEVLDAICRQLQSWLDFFSGANSLNAPAARAIAREHAPHDIQSPVEQFGSRLRSDHSRESNRGLLKSAERSWPSCNRCVVWNP